MLNTTNFDYYYSNPTQNYYFSFNTLFSDTFKPLSVEAKALYMLMIERANLSNKNHWTNNENKVYIIFTAKHVMDYFQCSEHTALKLLKELNEFGLIERQRTKIGQPHIIFVKVYHSIVDTPCDAQASVPEIPEKESDIPQQPTVSEPTAPEPKRPLISNYPVRGEYLKAMQEYWDTCEKLEKEQKEKEQKEKEQKQASTSAPSTPPAKNTVDTCKNCCCHLQNLQLSNINSSNTKFSIYSNSYLSNQSNKDKMDKNEIDNKKELIKQNIDYDILVQGYKVNNEDLDNIVDIMTDVMTSSKPAIAIAGEYRSTEVVKSVYSKLDMCDIQYVMECLSKNTTKINNIVAYVRTVLYNAKQTKGLYYQNLVQHDMAYHWK